MGTFRLCSVLVLGVMGAAVMVGGVFSRGLEMPIVTREKIVMECLIFKTQE